MKIPSTSLNGPYFFHQEWALTKTNLVRHHDMCLALKDPAPGKPVAIEGCRDGDDKQVGIPVTVKFLTTGLREDAQLRFNYPQHYNINV